VVAIDDAGMERVKACYARSTRRSNGGLDRSDYIWSRVRQNRDEIFQGFGLVGSDGALDAHTGRRCVNDRRGHEHHPRTSRGCHDDRWRGSDDDCRCRVGRRVVGGLLGRNHDRRRSGVVVGLGVAGRQSGKTNENGKAILERCTHDQLLTDVLVRLFVKGQATMAPAW
jgi:hypothetical protein